MSFTAFQILNGLTFASLLFLVASGFTLIFGLMRIVNLAHGAMYLMGGYVAYAMATAFDSFVLGVLSGAGAVALLGLVEQSLLRFARGVELRQVLMTLGLALMLDDAALVIFGGDTFTVPIPAILKGPFEFFGMSYPRYRLFVLLVGIIILVLLWLLMNRTRLGALIRAGVDDAGLVARRKGRVGVGDGEPRRRELGGRLAVRRGRLALPRGHAQRHAALRVVVERLPRPVRAGDGLELRVAPRLREVGVVRVGGGEVQAADAIYADLETEAERRIDDLRAFEADYRDRMRAYLEGLLRDLDGSEPGDSAVNPVTVSRDDLRVFFAALGGSEFMRPDCAAGAAERRLRAAAGGAS